MINAHKAIPEVVSGYELNKLQFSVIVPIERTNLILNPSFETNITGYTSVDGATLTRTTETQRRGVYSLRVKPGLASTSGLYYTTSALTAGNTYAFSLDIQGRGGRKYRMRVYDGIRNTVVRPIAGKGYWERPYCLFTAVTTGAHRLYLEKDDNTNTDNFFTDGWQLELCEVGNYWPTTYIDGDQIGLVQQAPPAYFWTGLAHSSTSVRNGQTRAGGRIIQFSDLGLTVFSVLGLGMTPYKNTSLDYALIGGAQFQRTIAGSRRFSIIAQVDSQTFNQLDKFRQLISDVFSPENISIKQPLVIVYESKNGERLYITCVYESGLEGAFNSNYQDRIRISFTQYDTSIAAEGNYGKQISYGQDLLDCDYLVKVDKNGTPSRMGTFNNEVYAMSYQNDGRLYLGGPFTTINGITFNRMAIWNGTSFENLGGTIGANNSVYSLILGADGFVYAAGTFTSIGGISANRIAKFNPLTGIWSALGTGAPSGVVVSLIYGLDGYLYAAGTFPSMGGIANTNGIARWDGANWSALGTGAAGGSGDVLAMGNDGAIYFGGNFTSVGGVANTAAIAKWSSGAWSSIGTAAGLSPSIVAMFINIDGSLYVGGLFTSIGGISMTNIGRWNGVQWSPLSTGIQGNVTQIEGDQVGNLYISGHLMTSAGPLANVLSRTVIWNGSDFLYYPSKQFTTLFNSDNKALPDKSGNIYRSITANNIKISFPGVTTVSNLGINTAPIFIIYGSGRLYQIANLTSGKLIQFDDLTLSDGEIITINLKPGFISFTSNLRGNILGYVIPSSNIADFFLQADDNLISVYIEDAGANCAAFIQWNNSYSGIQASSR